MESIAVDLSKLNLEMKVFRSRVSVLFIIFVLGIIFSPTVIMITPSGNSFFRFALYLLKGVFIYVLIAYVSNTRYIITEDHLILAPWRGLYSFPISAILSIERSYNQSKSMSASLKKLHIHFETGYRLSSVLISPVREQEFLETLKNCNPNINIRVDNKKGWWRFWDWNI